MIKLLIRHPTVLLFVISTTMQPQRFTLFPYTTLFRSRHWTHNVHRVTRWPSDDSLLPTVPLHSQHGVAPLPVTIVTDRKSTRLNSSHMSISYAVFCLKKKALLLVNSSTQKLKIITDSR